MNQFLAFKHTLTDAGIKFEQLSDDVVAHYSQVQNGFGIQVENSDGMGYSGFTSVWLFDSEGNMIATGAYE
jgi:hypothetical protein